jgi:Uma2 family endonuclease
MRVEDASVLEADEEVLPCRVDRGHRARGELGVRERGERRREADETAPGERAREGARRLQDRVAFGHGAHCAAPRLCSTLGRCPATLRRMAQAARRRATYDDVLAAPEDRIAELVGGELYVHPRPRRRHIRSASALGGFLFGAYDSGVHGPGGWVIVYEPELHLGPEPDILVPDLAGWREERYPGDVDDDDAFFTVAPDWVAEVLSTGTARFDRTRKLPVFARERIQHVWLVDPRDRTVEVLRLGAEGYVLVKSWGGEEEPAELEPFGGLPIPPAAFWGKRRAAR